jgi:hypothetical protein
MTQSTTRTALAIAATVMLAVAIAVAAVLVTSGGESAGPEDGVTLGDVVAEPHRYDGQTVTISGEWAENTYFSPTDASVALVIGDDADAKLLVVPDLGVDVPRLDDDTVVRVRGKVHALTEGDSAAGFVHPGGILESEGTHVLLTADQVAVTPPRRVTEGPSTDATTLAAILNDPRAFDGRLVSVTGTARPVPRGLILSAGGQDVFVSAPRSDVDAVSRGDQVQVQAKVQRLSGLAADTLETAFTTDPPSDEPGEPPILDRLPIDAGEPYLLLREIDV